MKNLTPNPDLRPPEMRKTTYFRKWVSRLDYVRSATKRKKVFSSAFPPLFLAYEKRREKLTDFYEGGEGKGKSWRKPCKFLLFCRLKQGDGRGRKKAAVEKRQTDEGREAWEVEGWGAEEALLRLRYDERLACSALPCPSPCLLSRPPSFFLPPPLPFHPFLKQERRGKGGGGRRWKRQQLFGRRANEELSCVHSQAAGRGRFSPRGSKLLFQGGSLRVFKNFWQNCLWKGEGEGRGKL